MGGAGSGNHGARYGAKTVVESCLRIDANRWSREGILKSGIPQRGSIRWTYKDGKDFSVNFEVSTLEMPGAFVRLWYSWVWVATQEQESADYSIQLTLTRPHFGGHRWWFICPLVVNGQPCNRRVGKLYLPRNARYFGCRHCHRLTYTSCQESHKFDSMDRHLSRTTGIDLDTIRRVLNRKQP